MTPTSTTNPGLQYPESALTEFYAGYYGWRVVLAACLGVMAGFGSLFVYTFTVFVKPLGTTFGWSREAVRSASASPQSPLASSLRCSAAGSTASALAASSSRAWPSTSAPSPGFLCWAQAYGSFPPASCSVCGQWRRASGLFPLHLHLVPAPSGYRPRLRNGRRGPGRDDSPRVCASHHQPRGMARRLSFPRWSCAAARLAAQLALRSRSRQRAPWRRPLNIPASPGSRACAPMRSGSSLRYCLSAPSA